MLKSNQLLSLSKWIQNWKKTYGNNPNLNECITWFEWEFKNNNLSKSDKSYIEGILKANSD